MIFLWLLGPDLAKFHAEFLASLSKGFFVCQRPWHEFFADLGFEDRLQRRLKRGPRLKAPFRARPEHTVDPIQHTRRSSFDPRAGGRAPPHLIELAPQG